MENKVVWFVTFVSFMWALNACWKFWAQVFLAARIYKVYLCNQQMFIKNESNTAPFAVELKHVWWTWYIIDVTK